MSIEEELQEGNMYKNRREDDSRDHKDKGKKCYIVEEDSDENDDEVVYVAMKDESDEDEATTLVTCVNKNDKWIIDSGCSHHMTGDKVSLLPLLNMMVIVLDLEMMLHV